MACILLAGGTGYIGSHVAVDLLKAGHEVVLFDNLSNSQREVVDRIQRITNRAPVFVEGDIRNPAQLDDLFAAHSIDAVILLAGLKAVGESVQKPHEYYDNNVVGAMQLTAAMERAGVQTIVFSSSATVYGDSKVLPFTETLPLQSTSPYAQTKLVVEQFLRDRQAANPDFWRVVNLRYFNPVGAHSSGMIGENPNGIPNNLFPFIANVAAGETEKLTIFGDDYPTADGTAIRDYIHVMDLARGHRAAVDFALAAEGGFEEAINLGAGKGYSVKECVDAWSREIGFELPHVIGPRRAGDIAEMAADASKAKRLLNWQTELDLDAMCRDHWNWRKLNPNGYDL